jgi:hypothetical protein
LDIKDLHGFGWSAHKKALDKLGTTTLGVLARKPRSVLCDALGRGTGETLWKAVRGIDERRLESDKPRKSVSCDITVRIAARLSILWLMETFFFAFGTSSMECGLRRVTRLKHLSIAWLEKWRSGWIPLTCEGER